MSDDYLPLEFGKKRHVAAAPPHEPPLQFRSRGTGGRGRGRGHGGHGDNRRGGRFGSRGGGDASRYTGQKRAFADAEAAPGGDVGARHFSAQMLLNPWLGWLASGSTHSTGTAAVSSVSSSSSTAAALVLMPPSAPVPELAENSRARLALNVLDALQQLGLALDDPELENKLHACLN